MSSLRRTLRQRHRADVLEYNAGRKRRDKIKTWVEPQDIPELVDYFNGWRQAPTWRVIEGETEEGTEQKGILNAKRGNVVFNSAVESSVKRLEMEAAGLPPFFTDEQLDADFKAGEEGRRARTPMLFLTLTAHDKGSELAPTWKGLMIEFNRAMARLRRHYRPTKERYQAYVSKTWEESTISQEDDPELSDIAARFVSQRGRAGEVRMFRSSEAHKSGYPHIHVVLWFADADFGVWEQVSRRQACERKDGSQYVKRTYRVEDNDLEELKAALKWPYHVDVLALKDAESAVRYVAGYLFKTYAEGPAPIKDYVDEQEGYVPDGTDKGLSTMALHSLMGKRAMGGLGAFIQDGLRILRRRARGAAPGTLWFDRMNELERPRRREGFELRNAISSRTAQGESEGEEPGEEEGWRYIGMAETSTLVKHQREIEPIEKEVRGQITVIRLTQRPAEEEMYRTAAELERIRIGREAARAELEALRQGRSQREAARARIRIETGLEPAPDLETEEEPGIVQERNTALLHELRWRRAEEWVRAHWVNCRNVNEAVRGLMRRRGRGEFDRASP